MSPLQIAALGIRLFAIWLAIYCARWAPYLYGVARDSDEIGITILSALAALLSVAAVLLLWFFPRSVARAILPASGPPPATAPSADTWLAIGCTQLGLWVLSEAVPATIRSVYVFAYTKRGNIALPDAWSGGFVYALVQSAIGAWLVLGATGLRKLLRWARGRQEQSE
jgi:hypothetical protein